MLPILPKLRWLNLLASRYVVLLISLDISFRLRNIFRFRLLSSFHFMLQLPHSRNSRQPSLLPSTLSLSRTLVSSTLGTFPVLSAWLLVWSLALPLWQEKVGPQLSFLHLPHPMSFVGLITAANTRIEKEVERHGSCTRTFLFPFFLFFCTDLEMFLLRTSSFA